MNLNGDSNTDDYFVTAVHIFKYCGVESTETLRVDALMDKFAPFIKTNKAEYSYLKSLLDPEENNPEVSVETLASVLNKYSESQKIKADLDESFNLKNGQGPHDSDSGISTEGFQLLEELQCELKEKAHLAQQLRSQLDFTDQHHEEQLATVTAERDSLLAHLNMLRDENITLSHVKLDYDDACDRLCCSERALEEATRDLDVARKRARVLVEQVAALESEKLTLQELLNKSKDECHRINEMYASRQSALLEENETLRNEHADVSARLQDQEEYMQQLIKEKVLLEMELKDVFNKSNQTHLRMDRSIDISYTDDQVLSALDSLNMDSQFAQENHLLDEESFTNALKEDQGRATNMSLFDEIRLSFCNISRRNTVDISCSGNFDNSMKVHTASTQTDELDDNVPCVHKNIAQITVSTDVETQTDSSPLLGEIENEPYVNNNIVQTCFDCTKCVECKKLRDYTTKLESDIKNLNNTLSGMQSNIDRYEEYLNNLQKLEEEDKSADMISQAYIDGLKSNIDIIATKCSLDCDGSDRIHYTHIQTGSAYSSVATQAEAPCLDCEVRKTAVQHRSIRRYFWEPLKCLFQLFAVVCFLCAISALYSITRRRGARCTRDPLPWRWLDAQDLVDLLLRIEYVADVPM